MKWVGRPEGRNGWRIGGKAVMPAGRLESVVITFSPFPLDDFVLLIGLSWVEATMALNIAQGIPVVVVAVQF